MTLYYIIGFHSVHESGWSIELTINVILKIFIQFSSESHSFSGTECILAITPLSTPSTILPKFESASYLFFYKDLKKDEKGKV